MNISFGVSSVTYDNQNNFKIDNVTIPCNISSDDSTKLLCNYTYESIIKGRTLTLQLGDTSGALFQRKLYLVKYAVTNLPLIKENYNLNFLSAISTRPFDFYLDDILLTVSTSEKNGIYTYIIPYYMLADVITEEGNYALYAKPENEDKLSVNDFHYIYITDKTISSVSTLYSQYMGIQKFTVSFDKPLIDNEMKSFIITMLNQIETISYTTKKDSCIRKANTTNTVVCDYELQSAASGTYQLSYINLNDKTFSYNEMLTLEETFALVNINPDLAEITAQKTITCSYNRNLAQYANIELYLVDKTTSAEILINETLTTTYNNISFVLSNNYFEGQYLIKTVIPNIEPFTSEDTYLVLYNKDSGVFDFNRLYIISDNELFTLTITPNLDTITNIYLENSNTPLEKKDNYYIYTIDANTEGKLKFLYTSTTAGENKIEIQKTVYVVKSSTELFTVTTSFNKCTFYGDYLSVTLTPVTDVNVESSRIQLVLHKIRNGLKEKEYSFSKSASGLVYTLEADDYNELLSGSYILYITENGDTDKHLELIEDISFTAITPPEYIFKSSNAITFSNVACELNLTGSLLTLLKGELIKSLPITDSNYDSTKRQITCTLEQGVIGSLTEYTFYQLFSNGNFLLGNLFISKETSQLTQEDLTISTIGNNIWVTGNYYIPLIKTLTVNEGTNTIEYVSSSLSTSSSDNTFTYNKTNNVLYFELSLENHSYYLQSIQSTVNDEIKQGLSIPISESAKDNLFTLDDTIFFIDATKEHPSIEITINVVAPNFSTDNIYIDSIRGVVARRDDTIRSNIKLILTLTN